MAQKLVKKTVRLTEEVAEVVNSKPNKAKFMRHAIEKEVNRKQKPTKIEINIEFANTGSIFNNELRIRTTALGNLKEKIVPLLESVQELQNIITYLDP